MCFCSHSGWQKLLQVMKGSRRNPLTQVSSTHMGSFETKIKKIWVRYLTYLFSKNKNSSISAEKIRVVWIVHQHFALPWIFFTEMRCLKNISINLVTLSIPKVAKNGLKVPILANLEIRPATYAYCTSLYLSTWAEFNFSVSPLMVMKIKPKITKKRRKFDRFLKITYENVTLLPST